MKVAFFSTKPYDREFFDLYNKTHEIVYHESALNTSTVQLAAGSDAVCVFVNDKLDAAVIGKLALLNVRLIALRCTGFNNVDLEAAHAAQIAVTRVPEYSPHAVAEHAVALIMTLNRKIHKAYNRVREGNFSLEKLMGFDLYGKTVGVVGTGKIGSAFCQIMTGFGCRVLAFDLVANKALEGIGVEYLPLLDVFEQSDIVSLHCPLNEQTHHLINNDTIHSFKKGAMLINTSRGGLVKALTVIRALKSGQLGSLGIDVYEQEEKLFFKDLSEEVIQDDLLTRLISFPNVIITAHQGFFTREALTRIAMTTLENISGLESKKTLNNAI